MKKILLIITGSIAAYKAVELIRLLQKKSYKVEVILTKSAQKFVTELLVASIAKNKIHTNLFDDGQNGMSHINLSRNNDLIIVAPASADFIAKMANGYGDDLASTTILAANKKIMVAPAMNEKMWNYHANLENIKKLENQSVIFLNPKKDELACGEIGIGKMQEPDQIIKKVDEFFEQSTALKGKNIIITGGSTQEMIDPVRFIGNKSSGKQAIYLAKILQEMGANIELIAANILPKIPIADKFITNVCSADEMYLKTSEKISQYPSKSTIFIACAAVCDYKPKKFSQNKIKKQEAKNLTIELEENIDILKTISNSSNRPSLVIGFAAEGCNIINYAQEKLKRKNCDLIIANNIENGQIFNSEESQAVLIDKNYQDQKLTKTSKLELAQKIASWICQNIQ